MAKLYFLLSLSVCFLILFNAQASRLGQQSPAAAAGRIQCQVQNINPLQPSRTIRSEGGVTQHWDENNEQLDCAGVSVTRHVIQPRGLLLPHFHNAPMLSYVIQGRGIHGAAMPGCPQTYQSAVQQQQQQSSVQQQQQGNHSRVGDQHQKVRSISQGDIIATPVGVANWIYNDGQTPLIIVTLLDTSNNENQLDDKRRTFYLGGNPQQRLRTPRGQEHSSNNIFSGFDDQMLAEAFGVSPRTARKLMGENDNRGNIILVQNELQLIMPPMSSRMGQQQQQNEEENQLNIQSIVGTPESLCNTKLRTNIDDPSRADVYNPRAGRINRVNSQKLPILSYLQLNAERGVLYSGALMAPHWNLNAHSVIYVTRGSARVQIVGNYQQPIYDGELHREQVLVVPQNFAVVKKAGDQGFEWISFKTNDNAVTHPIAGRNSAIRAMPREILMNAFRISSQEADRLKYSRQEFEIFAAPRSKCQGNGCVA